MDHPLPRVDRQTITGTPGGGTESRPLRLPSHPDDSGDYQHNWERLITKGLIPRDDVTNLQEVTTETKRDRISMSPGLRLRYSWSAEVERQLDRDGAFTEEVK